MTAAAGRNWTGDRGGSKLAPMGRPPTARQFPRYAIDAAIEVELEGTVRARGRTRDLSRGGLSAAVEGDVARGVRVDVHIALMLEAGHTSEPLTLPARVVWSTPLGGARQLGLAFLPLTGEQTADLELFVRFLEDGKDSGPAERARSHDD